MAWFLGSYTIMKSLSTGRKLYIPTISKIDGSGRSRRSRRKFQTATAARLYASRWAKRAIQLIHST